MARKPRLDKQAVVQAAADLLNREGSEALSLSRLAEQLGIQTPSLYNHVDGLAGLHRELALLNVQQMGDYFVNAALGKAGVEAILALAQAYRGYIKEFPGLYLASLRSSGTQSPIDPALQQAEARVLQITLTVVASLGLHGEEALHVVRGWRSLVHGFATLEVAGGFGLPLDCDESFARLLQTFIRGLGPV
ncbi:MAG: WHG domain-containing protein [Caldilineaceae bacterium]|nr:WHG domain-containing protein [Caldilineaceae bacterium]